MDKFLQAKLEACQTKTAGYAEGPAKEPHQKHSQGAVAKHIQSQSTEASSRQKKI